LTGLAEALLGFVLPGGGVLFSRDQELSNTWCAMFAHQALRLFASPPARAVFRAELLV
jgi:hypothetical protein